MRIRVAQIFPVSSIGQIALPKRPHSWRIVHAAVSWTLSATVANRYMMLEVLDGGNNLIADFTGVQLFGATSSPVTTFASVNSSYTGLFNEMIGIPDDLWIQPNWLASFRINQAQAGDTMSANVVIEYFHATKKGGRVEGGLAE